MKNIINTILMASLSAAMTACIGNYEEINYDHYGPGSGDVLADDYALGSAMNNLAGCVISPDVNTAQFTDCLLGGTMEDILPIHRIRGQILYPTITRQMTGRVFS